MTIGTTKFRTPKGEDYSAGTQPAFTIAVAGTYVNDSSVVWSAVGKLADFAGATGKLEPTADFPQDTKMRIKVKLNAEPAAGTKTLNFRVVDANDSNRVLAQGTAAAATATSSPTDYEFEGVALVKTDSDIVLAGANETDTANITVNSAEISVWHP